MSIQEKYCTNKHGENDPTRTLEQYHEKTFSNKAAAGEIRSQA